MEVIRMKKALSLVLVLCAILSLGVSCFAASPQYLARLDYVYGEKVSVAQTDTSVMDCSQNIVNCTSFVFNYDLSDDSGCGRWVAYCRQGKKDVWRKIQDFVIDDLEGSVKMTFTPAISFNQLAICKTSRYNFSYTVSTSITDVYCGGYSGNSSQQRTTPSAGTAPVTPGGSQKYMASLDFSYGDKETISGTYSYPFIFNQKIKNCTSLVFNYDLSDDGGVGRWVAYRKNGSNDTWHMCQNFVIDDLEGSVKMTFDTPITFDRLAVFRTSRYGFSYNGYFWFTDVYYKG